MNKRILEIDSQISTLQLERKDLASKKLQLDKQTAEDQEILGRLKVKRKSVIEEH